MSCFVRVVPCMHNFQGYFVVLKWDVCFCLHIEASHCLILRKKTLLFIGSKLVLIRSVNLALLVDFIKESDSLFMGELTVLVSILARKQTYTSLIISNWNHSLDSSVFYCGGTTYIIVCLVFFLQRIMLVIPCIKHFQLIFRQGLQSIFYQYLVIVKLSSTWVMTLYSRTAHCLSDEKNYLFIY